MKYKEFVELVRRNVESKLQENGQEIKLKLFETTKTNDQIVVGISFYEEGNNIAPTIYLESYYEEYQKGISLKEITDAVVELYKKARITNFDIESIENMDFEKLKDMIAFRLINYNYNQEFLQGIPHIRMDSLAIYLEIIISVNEAGKASLVIRNEMLEAWAKTVEELYDLALVNTKRLFPVELASMGVMLQELGGEIPECPVESEDMNNLLVLSNTIRNNGASSILYPEVVESIRAILDEFYILPSSISEVILVPQEGANPLMLGKMVRKVNQEAVAENELLGDCIYVAEIEEGKVILKEVEESK